jgi:hypothetical protein
VKDSGTGTSVMPASASASSVTTNSGLFAVTTPTALGRGERAASRAARWAAAAMTSR